MTRHRYQGLEFENESGRLTTVARHMAKVRRLASQKRYLDAYKEAMWLVHVLEEMGVGEPTLEILTELRDVIPLRSVDLQQRAWFFNSIGLAYTRTGKRGDTRRSFEQMLGIGKRLDDKFITSTALQNLGIQAALAGDRKGALVFYSESLKEKEEIRDARGFVQVLLNTASLYLDEGDLVRAREIVDDLAGLLIELHDPGLESSLNGILGTVHAKSGEFEAAEGSYRKALKLARRSDDVSRESTVQQNLGALFLDQGRYKQALPWFKKALRTAVLAHSHGPLRDAQIGLAVALHRAGRDKEAKTEFEKARILARAEGDFSAEARLTADLGAISVRAGDAQTGLSLLEPALRHFARTEDREWLKTTFFNIGSAHALLGNIKESREALEKAIQFVPPNVHSERADILWKEAEISLQDSDRLLTRRLFRRSLRELGKDEDQTRVAWQAALAGALLRDSRDFEGSLEFFTKSSDLYENLRNRQMAFHVRNDRANVLSDLGRLSEAEEEFRRCLRSGRRLKDRAMIVQALSNLGEVLRRKSRYKEAIRALGEATELARELGDDSAEAHALGNLGIALSNIDEWEQASDAFKHAWSIARRGQDRVTKATAAGGLASVAFAAGRYGEALRRYRQAARLSDEEGDSVHLVEDLAGITESLGALGRAKEVQAEAERLVHTAQSIGMDEVASEALARTARWFLRRDELAEACDLYAVSIPLSGTHEPEHRLVSRLAQAIMLVAIHVETDLPRKRHDTFFRMFVRRLDKQFDGLGKLLEEALRKSRDVAQATVEKSHFD